MTLPRKPVSTEETQAAATQQPMPTPREGGDVQALVVADIQERRAAGIAKYGTPLQTHNGRDAIVDAYQEALDLACYLRQFMAERRAGGWIRCEERFPEPGAFVLCCWGSGTPFVAQRLCGNWSDEADRIRVVDAWQPLPPSPEVQP